MWLYVSIGLAVVVALIVILTLWFPIKVLVWLKRRQLVTTAVVDVYQSGSYHIEYLQEQSLDPAALIQLSLLCLANVDGILPLYPSTERQPLLQLYKTVEDDPIAPRYFFAVEYRKQLIALAKLIGQETASDTLHPAVGVNERLSVGLIRGNKYNFVLCDFSMAIPGPHIARGAVYLYCDIASRLDDEALAILHLAVNRYRSAIYRYTYIELATGWTHTPFSCQRVADAVVLHLIPQLSPYTNQKI